MEDEKLADKLLDRILMVLMPYDQIDVERVKAKLTVVLDDYQISPKQEALAVYTEGKNDYYLRKFLLAKAVAGRQERTLRQYKDEVGRALRGIGKDADTITADYIQVYLAKVLSRGGSKCYCDNIRRDLSSFYNWLYREEIIRTNPMNKIDNIKFKREKEKALTDMEIEMMRQACLDRALREQKDRKTMNAIREVVASYATKADSKAAMPENCLFYASYGSWSGTVEAPADAGEHAYWYTESGYGITVYRERTEEDEPAEKTPEQLAREAKIEEYREKCRVIEEDEESAYRLRLNYLKEYGFPKKAAETVALAACRMMILNPDALGDMDEDTIEAVYGDGIYNDEHDLDTAVLMENAQVNPMKMLMVLLFALTEPVNHRVHDTEWLGGFYKCIKDDESVYRGIYSALDGIGYEISDMEKSLLDGTHPSYEGAEEES